MPSENFLQLRRAMLTKKPLEQLKQMFKSGVTLDEFDDEGISIYHSAILSSRYDFIHYLLDEEKLDINQRTKEGLTPIQYIIKKKMSYAYDKISFFVERGVDVNATCQFNMTALHLACAEGGKKAVLRLIENNANIDAQSGVIEAEGQRIGGWRPLHIAAQQGFADIVELLIARGAAKNQLDYTGLTPLLIACNSGAEGAAVAIALANSGADVNQIYPNGNTPLHTAAKKNQIEVVKALLANGAKPNAINSALLSPLGAISKSSEHTEVARVLIAAGAETETLLDKAAREKQEIIFEGHRKRLEVLQGVKAGLNETASSDSNMSNSYKENTVNRVPAGQTGGTMYLSPKTPNNLQLRLSPKQPMNGERDGDGVDETPSIGRHPGKQGNGCAVM